MKAIRWLISGRPPIARQPAKAMITAMAAVIRVSVAGPARALALAPFMRWPRRRSTTSATRASSSASRVSILTILMPSRLSITAVDRAEVSSMARLAASRVRRTKWRMTQAIIGATTISSPASTGSSTTITTAEAITASRFWV